MGKGKQKFNKKQAVRFTLVPGFDENGKPITHFRPVETKKSKVNQRDRQKLILQISDQKYDQIEIDGKLVGQNQIPAFVLEQIKGRKDLVFNQKGMNEKFQKQSALGDLYEVMDEKDYEEYDDFDSEDEEKVWIEEEDIIDEDYKEDDMEEGEEDWEDDNDSMEGEWIDEEQSKKESMQTFRLKESEFPVLTKVNLEGMQCELTEAQIKLLDVLIPENYQNFEIQGIQFQKYDQNGLPLSQKSKYQEFLADGTQGVVDSFDYVPDAPTPIYDTDLKPSQITGDLKQIEDALNFDGEEGVYEELEDDFFSNMIKAEIQAHKKSKTAKKFKPIKSAQNDLKSKPQQIKKINLPKQLQKLSSKRQENVFAKYDQLDEDVLEDQITDEMLDKALDDFEHNLEPKQAVKVHNNKTIDFEDEEEMEETMSRNNTSMNFSELEKCPELIGKDGELDWRCLTRKEKKEYMKTKIIRSFYEEIRERQIQEKLKGKKNITAEQLHLKTLVDKLSLQDDHVMRRALEEHANEQVDLDEESSYESESDEEDIIEYRQRTSVISSNLNEITEPSSKKKKNKKDDSQDKTNQLQQLSETLSKLKSASQKRNRNETKEERKARKEKQKQLKKQKKEIKKQFAQKFAEQRRKHIKMTKPSDPLHKVSYVKII